MIVILSAAKDLLSLSRSFVASLLRMTYLHSMWRSSALTAVAMVAIAQPALAQCADGSPPPCRTRTVASATVSRRADPPMDSKTWIVVPFDNLNNSQDIEWLRTGSVNLLYLGMSRWTDIRVIDDERVADFMRDVPGASEAKSLTASQAIAVAKRAGAAQVVMGDVLKLGNKTTINAKVFDVKTGQRIRSVREETTIADSLMAAFTKLSQKVLNIPPPVGAGSGAIVTSSLAAYQQYAEGMAALNRFDLIGANNHLLRALELDSTFALAHAKLSVLLGWLAPGTPGGRQHAEAAARLSGSLPAREQALIKASVAFSKQEYETACAGFSALIKKDSTDTDAWYGLGDCLYHDNALLPTEGDSTRPRFRADRNASIRAFQAVLALDPTYHLAYQHVVESYNNPLLGSGGWCVGGRCSQVLAVVRPSGDSLLFVPLMLPRDTVLYRQHLDEASRRGARRAMLQQGRTIAERWVAANPAEGRAQLMYATTLAALGELVAADSILKRAVLTDTGSSSVNALMLRLELSLKAWRGPSAVALFDSVRKRPVIMGRSAAGVMTTGNLVTLVTPMLGRPALYDSLISVGMRQSGAPSSRERLSKQFTRAVMGVPQDSFVAIAATVFNDVSAAAGSVTATRAIAPVFAYSLRGSTDGWPTLDTTVTDARSAPAIALQRKDTAALRRAARRLDSLSSRYVTMLLPDTGVTLIAAESFLVLRDSARALQLTRRWLDSVLTYTPVLAGQSGSTFVHQLAPRAAWMRADLAAALGSRDEARLWYDRLLSVWVGADPDMQPLMERVRKSRAALGP
jgi:TolB-like protein